MRFARLFFFCACALAACAAATEGDTPADPTPAPPSGGDKRIRDLRDPSVQDRPKHMDPVAVSGAVVVHVDDFDETGNGQSKGTIYVSDVGSKEPYSGISLFAPSFVPGNLRVGPGDVLDFRGQFQENQRIGTSGNADFAPGAVLPQLSRPIGTFRYEFEAPEPVDIDVKDLDDYTKGAKWIGMLVRVKNVQIYGDAFRTDMNDPMKLAANVRISAPLSPSPPPEAGTRACQDPFPKAASLTNEFVDIAQKRYPNGQRFASIVGVVTYFCNLHLSPRSLDDIKTN